LFFGLDFPDTLFGFPGCLFGFLCKFGKNSNFLLFVWFSQIFCLVFPDFYLDFTFARFLHPRESQGIISSRKV
jgi:hypothetical protein